ncbi:uncharacterized protein LOC134267073 [Saccostrea cucullata]|uniref:uncharacterized protein LOC134267073 n=1 Tax=Saccostrea cuccullata TaxID=36930 RepID=UPI002ED47647
MATRLGWITSAILLVLCKYLLSQKHTTDFHYQCSECTCLLDSSVCKNCTYTDVEDNNISWKRTLTESRKYPSYFQSLLVGVIICGILVIILTGIVIFLVIHIFRLKRRHCYDEREGIQNAESVSSASPNTDYIIPIQAQDDIQPEQHYRELSSVNMVNEYVEIVQ